jgi:signal transduction histidine kinase/HAMP domain-containing protein
MTNRGDADDALVADSSDGPASPGGSRIGSRMPFRVRLTIALISAAVFPLAGFGLVLLTEFRDGGSGSALASVLLFAIAAATILGVLLALILAADLTAPLRAIAAAVDRASNGDLSTRIEVAGEDELARLAESHNRLSADLDRRNRELRRILAAIVEAAPGLGIDRLAEMAGENARTAFAMIDAVVLLVDPREIPTEEWVPGEPRPLRALLRVGEDTLGVIVGRLPATRTWEPADQDLLELFAAEIAVAIRNAQLFERVETQNQLLVDLDAAKDDFLRGVSHNLQTPLTSIRAYAEQLATDRPDRRLAIIAEQSDRLSRMVRQLLTVSRLESGALKPRSEVLAISSHVRRAWEALGQTGAVLDVDDGAAGWLAVADPDQLDQVLWALLDNAVKYGGGTPVTATIEPLPEARQVRLTIADSGPGIAGPDRDSLFERFSRGGAEDRAEGTGLGLYVSRELCRAMGGDLRLEGAATEVAWAGGNREAGGNPEAVRSDRDDVGDPDTDTVGAPRTLRAAFTILLPGEPPEEP